MADLKLTVGLTLMILIGLQAAAGEVLPSKWRGEDGATVWVRVEADSSELRIYAPRSVACVRWAVLFETPSNRGRWELSSEPPPGAPPQRCTDGEAWVWQGSEWRRLRIVVVRVHDAPHTTAHPQARIGSI